MKLAIILGTRPEVIKMAPVIKACLAKKIDFFVVHTGQHYSPIMDTEIFKDVGLKAPAYNIGVGFGDYGQQLGFMVEMLVNILSKECPTEVLVQGDTNSVLAGAIAAKRLGIKVGHVEAGLRSGDLSMREEVNRIIVDNLSDHLFAPTENSVKNLMAEGKKNAVNVGNTIVDAVADGVSRMSPNIHHPGHEFGLATIHRAENVDNPIKLQDILSGLGEASRKLNLPIILPIHPRTQKKMEEYTIEVPKGIQVAKPMGFLDFLWYEMEAKIIFTDSGGVQEEAFILKVPCVTIRDNTERPETIECGGNKLAGATGFNLLAVARGMLKRKKFVGAPFGDGHAGEKIVQFLIDDNKK